MDKAEYNVAMYHCYLRCEPQEEKCKDCELLKIYREIYDTGRKSPMEVSATMFEKDMHGNTVKEEVHITYFFNEWADF